MRRFNCEVVLVARIPGASHCARQFPVVALIDEREVIERIIRHLGLREQGARHSVPRYTQQENGHRTLAR